MMETVFTIGALSTHASVKIETIRYYERIGLIPAPGRSAGGHRQYDVAAARRLRFIRRSRDLGFSLDDIRSLLGLDEGRPTCGEVMSLTLAHLDRIRAKISDLKKLERALSKAVKSCEGGADPECPVIETLST